MLQEHLLTGLLFLCALFIDSLKTGPYSVVGILVSLMVAYPFRKKSKNFSRGIYGYNGLLIGSMVASFVPSHTLLYVLLGASLSVLFQIGVERYFTKLPLLTTPFVLISWITVQFNPIKSSPFPDFSFIDYFFHNISQVFLVGNTLSGILILVGVFISSPRGGIWMVLASVLTLIFQQLTGVPVYGFSAVLVPLALNTKVHHIYTFIGTILALVLQSTLGPEAFTGPFILSVWIILLVSKSLTGSRFFQNTGT